MKHFTLDECLPKCKDYIELASIGMNMKYKSHILWYLQEYFCNLISQVQTQTLLYRIQNQHYLDIV